MLHVPLAPPATMTAPRYLQLRRLAARMTVKDVAERLAPRLRDRAAATALVALLETEGAVARHDTTLAALGHVFAFDPLVYRQVSETPADRHPEICEGCGCSHWDPCESESGCCSWSAPGQCSHCADAAACALPRVGERA